MSDFALPAEFEIPPAEPLDPQIQLLQDKLPQGLAMEIGKDPVKSREQFRRITVALRDRQPPADLAEIRDIAVPGAAGELRARVYVPRQEAATGAILFIHGGAFVVGDIESYDLQARAIAERTGMQVISAEYRLAPEHPFPAAVEDVESVARWAVQNAGDFGDGGVILMGDSAGGNLCAVAAGRVDGITGQVLIYSVTDVVHNHLSIEEHASGPVLKRDAEGSIRAAYIRDSDPQDPRLSPLLADGAEELPPAIVVTCEYDILRDTGLAYAAKLREAGVLFRHLHYPSLMHGFMGFFPLSAACDAALSEICAQVRELDGR